MRLFQLDKEEVIKAAKKIFVNNDITYDEIDIYFKDIESGCVKIDDNDEKIYVSTHYGYEDLIVKGNKTRYKVKLSTIIIKNDPYEIVFDESKVMYVAYKQDDEIKFVLYKDFDDLIKNQINVIE